MILSCSYIDRVCTFTVLLRYSLFEMPSGNLFMTPMRKKKTLVFATIPLRFCSFFRLLDAIASRQFLNNETTVCQRQQQKRTHIHEEKNRQNRNHKIDLQKKQSWPLHHTRSSRNSKVYSFFLSFTINRKDGKKRYSQ